VAEASATIAATRQEHSERRVGLAISSLAVSLLAVMLFLKIRQLDRRGRRADAPEE
jgi:hypothetical protein